MTHQSLLQNLFEALPLHSQHLHQDSTRKTAELYSYTTSHDLDPSHWVLAAAAAVAGACAAHNQQSSRRCWAQKGLTSQRLEDWKTLNIHTYIDIHWYRYVLIYSRLNGFKSGGPKQVPNVPKRGSSCGQKKTEWKAWYGAMQHHGVAPQWTDGGCTSSCSQFVEQFRFWPNMWGMNYHSDIFGDVLQQHHGCSE